MITQHAKQEDLSLTISNLQRTRWERMANLLGLSIYEYIRRCTDAHTTILETDSFNFVSDYDQYHSIVV